MAIRQNPDGTVEIFDDVTGATLSEGVPPDMLGSLYNPGAIAPPPSEADPRLAGPPTSSARDVSQAAVGPTGVQSPTQAPGMSDIMKAMGPSITMVPGSSSSPSPTSSEPAPTPGTPAPGAAPPGSTDPSGPASSYGGLTEQGLRAEALRLMQPRAGMRVNQPAKNVLRNFQVGVTPKLDPETKEETDLARELSFTKAGRYAAEGGMLESASHEDAALMYEQRKRDAQVELSGIRVQEQDRDRVVGARMREIDMLGEELRSKRKGASNPDAYWDDKGVFGTIMAKIGMALYAGGSGIAGYDPLGLTKEINAEAARYNDAKRIEVDLLGKEIEGKESQLERVRSQFISRDAAEHATRALMNESMAAETMTLSESYKSADARNTALQIVNQLQMQATEARAAAELAEKDAITQSWQHQEAMKGVVGGGPGMDVFKIADKMFPGDPERVMKAVQLIQEQKLPASKQDFDIWKASQDKAGAAGSSMLQKYHEQGLVRLPDGRVAFTNHGELAAKQAQAVLAAMPKLRNNLKRIRQIVAGVSTISKLSPDDRAEISSLARISAPYAKTVGKEAMTLGEWQEIWGPLVGGDIGKIFRWMNEEKQLDVAVKATRQYESYEHGQLSEPPPGATLPPPFVPPVPDEMSEDE